MLSFSLLIRLCHKYFNWNFSRNWSRKCHEVQKIQFPQWFLLITACTYLQSTRYIAVYSAHHSLDISIATEQKMIAHPPISMIIFNYWALMKTNLAQLSHSSTQSSPHYKPYQRVARSLIELNWKTTSFVSLLMLLFVVFWVSQFVSFWSNH